MIGIREILERYRVIAVVGLSRDETKYSYRVARFMKEAGYTIIPVNPFAEELLGETVYKDLWGMPSAPEIVDVFRPAEEALAVTKQAVGVGARAVWLQEGIVSDEERNYAESHGLAFVQDRCIMKEYVKLKG